VALRLQNLPPREVLGQCHREGFVSNPRQDHGHTLGIFVDRIAVKDRRVTTQSILDVDNFVLCDLVGAGDR